MDRQSKSASIPLTSQHVGADTQQDFGWEETYKKLNSLGRGGCAEVFRALNRRSGELVALKVSNESGEELRRFRREVMTLRELRHQNVIEILDDGDCWYTMPLADGNLTKLAPELCDEERIEAVAQAAQGLAAVHIAGRVHRDVSPNNILRIGKRWVVSDFGFVRKPQGTSSEPKTQGAMGTPGYMAPEVLALGSHSATPHSDMYSLGQTVAFITTGKHPIAGERPHVPRIWESLVSRMTAVAVSKRFQTMDELAEALLSVQFQLKEQRKAEWLAGRNALGVMLSQAELTVMKMVIEETNNIFREQEILNGSSRRERGIFNIGIIALKRRSFLEDNFDDEGRPWGYRLTDAAHNWLMANSGFLNAFPPSEPEPSKDNAQDDDGIPF